MSYIELQTTTNYSFLRGGSHPHELFAMAALLGYRILGVADHNTMAGIVQAHLRASEAGVRLLIGCRVDLRDAPSCLLYPADRAAYGRLCRLLSLGKQRAAQEGGDHNGCWLDWQDLAFHAEGLLAILLPDQPDDGLRQNLHRLRDVFDDRAYVALTRQFRPLDTSRLRGIAAMADGIGIRSVATNDVLYHMPQRRMLQDVLSCIREGCTIDELGFRRERSGDRYLKAPEEMQRLFAAHPDAVVCTQEIADRCQFNLSELRYQYPQETEPGETAQAKLERLVTEYTPRRYPNGVPANVTKQIRHELDLIKHLEYAPYFLTVHSIVRYAESQEILCQGRGSAANSAVCYVLKITSIDPVESNLLFERFISAERREPPDIDVDFEHDQRERVIQWVYSHYGRDRAALCATVMRFQSRGAIRDVGKALGLTEDVTSALVSQIWRSWSQEGVTEAQAAELKLNLQDRRLRLTLELARELIGFPRQLGTHPGGFVLTSDALADLVPIKQAAMQDRQVIEWDKDDIDVLKFMKVDVLGLGMLGCLRRCFDLLEEQTGQRLDMASVPSGDAQTYAMIQKADTIGLFQIESRAQMSMLPRMKPDCLYDLVIQIAIVRPGPIQGDMVHPYLSRRANRNKEKIDYITPELEKVLEKTLGVPLFQEQAMQVAIVCAGFTPSEADKLRRSMATFKATGGVAHFREKLVSGMLVNGYPEEFAQRMVKQLEGFGSYGFPESHAASFAIIAYASAYLKSHYPAIFCCALLNSQPMGFYAPAQLVRDARMHGVEVRPVCINQSRWDSTLEPVRGGWAVRLGMQRVKGLSGAHAASIIMHRGEHPYESLESVWRRAKVPVAALGRLAEADAFHSLHLDRRQALWTIKGLADEELPLFAAVNHGNQHAAPESLEPMVLLPSLTKGREVVEDYRHTGLSLRKHPLFFLRSAFAPTVTTCAGLADVKDGKRVSLGGLILVRQRPGSAKGVMFLTVEDETGCANVIVWPSLFERQRRVIISASLMLCHGRLQKEAGVIHVVADRFEDRTDLLRGLGAISDTESEPDTSAGHRKPRDVWLPELHNVIKVPSRDFH